VAHGHVARQRCFGDLLGLQAGSDSLAAGLHHVPAATVVEGHRQGDAGVVLGGLLGFGPGRTQAIRHGIAVTHDDNLDAITGQLAQVFGDGHQHQAHQARDFVFGALPVLGREGKHGEVLDAAVGTGVDHLDQRIHTGLVAEEARQVALLRPAPIAIHHDGHVARHR